MGLLDDAIREHLELKRRSGADVTELSKLEHDAFGPVRREEIAVDPSEPDEAGPELFDDEVAPTHAPEPTAYEPPPAPEPAAYEPPPAPAYEPPPAPVEHERPRAPAEPLPPAEDPQATVAFSSIPEQAPPVEDDAAAPDPDVVAADEEPGEHDELEETPEFLQETPEHDRLWFEQKPPRDFDF